MPEMNGIDFVRSLRSTPHGKSVPVLMVTPVVRRRSQRQRERSIIGVRPHAERPDERRPTTRTASAQASEPRQTNARCSPARASCTPAWSGTRGARGAGVLSALVWPFACRRARTIRWRSR
jgi:hypothetical protein